MSLLVHIEPFIRKDIIVFRPRLNVVLVIEEPLGRVLLQQAEVRCIRRRRSLFDELLTRSVQVLGGDVLDVG